MYWFSDTLIMPPPKKRTMETGWCEALKRVLGLLPHGSLIVGSVSWGKIFLLVSFKSAMELCCKCLCDHCGEVVQRSLEG